MKSRKTDKKEFSLLLEENKRIIHKIALLYTNNRADKDDLVQDICLQLWKSYSSYKEEAKFSTWLYRVALNTAIGQLRRRKKSIDIEDVYDPQIEDDKQEKEEQVKLLFKAISTLGKIDRAIIILWMENNKYKDIAEILGISASNVSVRLFRIKKCLAETVKELENG